ncbi:hypothetical protein SODALDRAFT_381031 [Sodiomyces alkalinus F11]|uniref:Uncharacterized protein n=1 Tax=Sodiomyces alkalinus (strain CBS 110278 / VKM F-3762 / F11) TaxID=1314773 RepID=A0A3N2PMI3_SODAK|nr:hypothetical protein SODALDRAFT_381031 [Sodiomyces alkalinus F11]ROT35735.1 hypothetical protein SODALDRAFT_381031 [Sodiomyces alkalinus F11]
MARLTVRGHHPKRSIGPPTCLLPGTLEANDARAHILVYGYNADVLTFQKNGTASKNYISRHAQTNSLGGILLKAALLQPVPCMYVSTYGIIFLGTLHTGSDPAAWGRNAAADGRCRHSQEALGARVRLDQHAPERRRDPQQYYLRLCQPLSWTLQGPHGHENQKTNIRGASVIVVDGNSACPPLLRVTRYGIEATHSGMCKFQNRDASGYRNVSETLFGVARQSAITIISLPGIPTRKQMSALQAVPAFGNPSGTVPCPVQSARKGKATGGEQHQGAFSQPTEPTRCLPSVEESQTHILPCMGAAKMSDWDGEIEVL